MKKGFTLIELLAVIIILAILMIIAVPSVLKTLNKARDEAFITQAQSIFRGANNQYLVDSMSGTQKTCYTLADIDMDDNANLSAIIRFDAKEGSISSIRVADKGQKRYATGTSTVNGITKQDWNEAFNANGVGTCDSEVTGA